MLLLLLCFGEIYASIMAEYQADLAVAQRVLNAVKDNVDMDKTETKLLVVLAI